MLTRTRSNSFMVRGALKRAAQFAGRSTGQGDNNALIASVSRVLDHRLTHRQLPEQSQQLVVTLYRETLESSLHAG